MAFAVLPDYARTAQCPRCDGTFIALHPSAKYCSAACRQAEYRSRRAVQEETRTA